MDGEKKLPEIKLPVRLVSRRDLLQTIREMEQLRDQLVAQKVKRDDDFAPMLSDRLRDLLETNDIKHLDANSLDKLKHELQYMADRLPMLRFTFAGEPDGPFIRRLVEWVRRELHPSALVIYSVQPHIAGGFILTTDRKRYDLSWRYKLHEKPMKLGPLLRRMEEQGGS